MHQKTRRRSIMPGTQRVPLVQLRIERKMRQSSRRANPPPSMEIRSRRSRHSHHHWRSHDCSVVPPPQSEEGEPREVGAILQRASCLSPFDHVDVACEELAVDDAPGHREFFSNFGTLVCQVQFTHCSTPTQPVNHFTETTQWDTRPP